MIKQLKEISENLKKIAELQTEEQPIKHKFVKVASDKVLSFIKFYGTLGVK